MPPRAGGGVPSSQARPSGGCQSGVGPRRALRAATGRRVRGEVGRPRARPRPPSRGRRPPPPQESQPHPWTTATPNPRTGPGLERARTGWSPREGLRGVGVRAWRGVCATWKVFIVSRRHPEERQARKVTAVHQWLRESEKSLPVSLLALGGAARAWRSRIVLIRASLCRRL